MQVITIGNEVDLILVDKTNIQYLNYKLDLEFKQNVKP